MIRPRDPVFVDSGAWIALALVRDPHHSEARDAWATLTGAAARLHTSVPVVMETYTFLDRQSSQVVARAWRSSLDEVKGLRILDFRAADLPQAWQWCDRRDLHRLSAVDASSFVLMEKARIRTAFTFDHHFAMAGFKLVAP